MDISKQYLVGESPEEIEKAAIKYEERFKIKFHSLTYFPKALLDKLFLADEDIHGFSDVVNVASHNDKTILKDIEILTRIANGSTISLDDREEYFSTLKSVYEKLPIQPGNKCHDEGTLFVAPEREGRILAEAMGWLPYGHSLHPNAKRIPYNDGLIVGLDQFDIQPLYKNCVVVDGAIASGVTIMAIMDKLSTVTKSFHIYSVHSTFEGLRAVTRYGGSLGVNVDITLGHATSGMNEKFYAVLPSNPSKLIVGDLGDTISMQKM